MNAKALATALGLALATVIGAPFDARAACLDPGVSAGDPSSDAGPTSDEAAELDLAQTDSTSTLGGTEGSGAAPETLAFGPTGGSPGGFEQATYPGLTSGTLDGPSHPPLSVINDFTLTGDSQAGLGGHGSTGGPTFNVSGPTSIDDASSLANRVQDAARQRITRTPVTVSRVPGFFGPFPASIAFPCSFLLVIVGGSLLGVRHYRHKSLA